MTVVDAHVHLLPGRLGEKVRAHFDAGGAGALLVYPNDHAAVVDRLADEGVDELWTLPYAHKPGVAAGLNESSARTVAEFAGGRLVVTGGATVHPADDDPAAIVRDAVDRLGLKVLKLHCSVGSFDVDDRRLDPVMALAAERRLPVVVHLGHGPDGRTEREELPAIGRVSDRHPTVPLILAHAGHHSARDAVLLLDRHPGLHLDLTPVVVEHPDLDAVQLGAHSDRVLFGSDAPNTGRRVTQGLEWLGSLDLPPGSLAAILGGVARHLTAQVLTDR
jgi:uncharacterized protein